ncbi:TonB-dependent receptor [Sphingomicrobium astaxanthinifaciens]|uniref:TonB-dependent receptor n=1 Tax=Sphingomicrobium astaxanthinifaciens TaxID=1227949 RepID=UPI001FCB6C1C|nr:TonB-dependent receptor [Sphingomicrobium astaxanthinifaciens]MCJ7421571.1 TonB-dependent receptor [Sphingomicrobium astaxanthinifaciens]
MATATAFAATPAAAQVTGDEDSVLQDAEEGFGVIVITAQRREENLQDVPISVATVGDDTLAAINAGGADIRGLAGRVPSLNIESSFGRTFPRFYIRGLGNTDFDLNASQPVSLVYDEVVLENPILKGFPVFDLDRVEVLRGPQGTLFGRNTPAGIVKFDTVKPGLTAENYAKASWGSYNSITAEAGVGAMLADNVAVRVSGLYQHRDDWIDNLDAPGENNLEGYDDVAARVQLLVEPNEASSLRLTGQLRSQQGSARVFRANLFETGSNELVGVDGGEFVRSQVRGDGLNFQELDNYNLSAHFDYDLGPVTLYSITSYWAGQLFSRGDIDGGFGASFLPDMGPGFIPFPAQSQDNIPSLDQFTQELRIASNNTDGLGYQAGVFYFNEKIDIESFDFATPTDLTPVAIVDQRQDAEALGLFGSLSYAFDSGLTLQAGARYNLDDKTLVAERPLDGRAFFGGPVPAMTLEADDEVLTWDVSGVYEVDDQINLFARVAKGYRAPSLQGRILFDRDMSRADSETTMSYEAGVKTSFDSVMFNLTGYMFTTDDLQLSAVGGATNANLLLNAEEVNGSGIEAELMARPARGLTLTAGVSYNSAKIDDPDLVVESCGAACIVLDPVVVPFNPVTFDPAQVLIDGNQLPQAPEWTANWTLGYEHPVGAGDLYLFTDWYYRSKIIFFLYESVEFSDDRLLEGGLRVGYKTDDFDVAVFARNILDDASAVGGIDFNNLTGFVNEPRIIGAEIGVNF